MADRPPKFLANGQPDGRGRSAGSKAAQFAAGDGRPRPGRKKKSRDERSIVAEIRDMLVPIKGSDKRVPLRIAMIRKVAAKALTGDAKAVDYMQKLFDKYEPAPDVSGLTATLLEADQFILNYAAQRGVLPARVEAQVDDPAASPNDGSPDHDH